MQPEGKQQLPVVRGLETHCRKNSARAVGKGLLREPTGDLGTSSSSLAGEHFIELSGKGVSISQEASGSSHQAPSEHKSASGLLNTPAAPPQSLHPGPTSCSAGFNHAPDTCCPGITYPLSGRTTRLSSPSTRGIGQWDVRTAPSLAGLTQSPSVLPRVP